MSALRGSKSVERTFLDNFVYKTNAFLMMSIFFYNTAPAKITLLCPESAKHYKTNGFCMVSHGLPWSPVVSRGLPYFYHGLPTFIMVSRTFIMVSRTFIMVSRTFIIVSRTFKFLGQANLR